MINFKPRPEPMMKKWLQNPSFYLSIIVVVLITSWFFLEKNPVQSLWVGFKNSSFGAKVIGSSAKSPQEENLGDADTADANAMTEAGSPDIDLASATAQDAIDPADPEAALKLAQRKLDQTNPETGQNPNRNNQEWKVTFAELPVAQRTALLEALRTDGSLESNEFVTWGKLNDKAIIKELRAKAKAVGTETFIGRDPMVNQFEFFWGLQRIAPETEREQGISLAMAWATAPEGGLVRNEFEISSQFREEGPTLPAVIKTVHGVTEIPPSGVIILMGLLPRRVYLPEKSEDLSFDSVLKVFESPLFTRNQSEFTMWIEFDTPSSKSP